MSAPTRLAVTVALLIAGATVYVAVPASGLVKTITASVMWAFAGLYAFGLEGSAMWRGAAYALAALAVVGVVGVWVAFVVNL